MSAGLTRWVRCDGGDGLMCDAEVYLMTPEATEVEVRTVARSAGWARVGNLDLCRAHKPTDQEDGR